MASDNKQKHYYGHRSRLKERFKRSADSLEDYEVLELLLGYVIKRSDVKPMAKDIVNKIKPLKDIFNYDFTKIDGLGKETEVFFKILSEFNVRIEKSVFDKRVRIDNPEKIFPYLQKKIGFMDKEVMLLISLDFKYSLLSIDTISQGTIDKAVVFTREVVEKAMLSRASRVILAHNHPTGDLKPSMNDDILTEKISLGLKAVDIQLLDHMIISAESYYSFRANKKKL